MYGLSDRGIVHLKIAANGAHEDFAGIQAHPNLDPNSFCPPDFLRMSRYAFLHHEGRIRGPDSVIFVCHWRTEQRHDSVAHKMTDGPLVPVHGVDHQFEYGVEQPACIFRIATEQQLQRALDVGE